MSAQDDCSRDLECLQDLLRESSALLDFVYTTVQQLSSSASTPLLSLLDLICRRYPKVGQDCTLMDACLSGFQDGWMAGSLGLCVCVGGARMKMVSGTCR